MYFFLRMRLEHGTKLYNAITNQLTIIAVVLRIFYYRSSAESNNERGGVDRCLSRAFTAAHKVSCLEEQEIGKIT